MLAIEPLFQGAAVRRRRPSPVGGCAHGVVALLLACPGGVPPWPGGVPPWPGGVGVLNVVGVLVDELVPLDVVELVVVVGVEELVLLELLVVVGVLVE